MPRPGRESAAAAGGRGRRDGSRSRALPLPLPPRQTTGEQRRAAAAAATNREICGRSGPARAARGAVASASVCRMRYSESVVDLIGNTPLVRLRHRVTTGLRRPTVLAKVEYFNPGGSVKDRIAVRMIDAAEQSGELQARRDDRRADVGQHRHRAGASSPSSAATTASSSARTRSAATRSTRCGPTAPRSSSARPRSRPRTRARTTRCRTGWPARRPAGGSPTSTPTRTTRARTTRPPGPELWEQTDGRITHFVAGVGTGGTISGAGRYLKEMSGGRVRIIGADPEGSVYSGGTGRPYLVEGVGEDFWPTTYDRDDLRRDHRGLRRATPSR